MSKFVALDKWERLGLAAKKFVVLVATCGMAMMASANPTGGVVTSGSATIAKPTGNTQVIQQNSQQAIIQWQTFNIAPNQTTRFIQPNSSATVLNRINPNQGASQIFGKLQANGRIILVNQAGIYFGPGSRVDVGSIIASTADISDKNFKAGKFIFDKPSQYAGSVINRGTINAADYGLVALVGKSVVNEGVINARMGNVVLASGNKFTFDFSGDQLINFSIDEEADSAGIDQEGKQLKNGVSNSGQILADGGTVRLSGKAARGVVDNVINMSGVIQAKSVSQKNGVIILGGGNGPVSVSGKIIATGHGVGQRGGKVKILGKQVVVKKTAVVDVSGDAGGGEILVGGNYQGKGPEQNATTTVVEQGALLNADALRYGNGGRVIVWADDSTFFHGNIYARGGALGGNGGFVETSGHQYLDITNAFVTTRADAGLFGTWLLDPANITISNSADSNAAYSNPNYAPTSGAATSNINVTNLQNALANNNVTVTTTNTGSAGAGAGTITVVDPITWATSAVLTLNAASTITINAAITATNGGLVLNAVNTAQSIQTGASGTINVGNFNITQGHWYQNTATLPAFYARNFILNSGNGASASVSFTRVVGGNGIATPYLIADVYGLQGIGSGTSSGPLGPGAGNSGGGRTLSYLYSLNNNIDASGTINWTPSGGTGFRTIGSGSTAYTGTFDGRGYTIDKLYMNSSATTGNSGLFSTLGGAAVIKNVGLTNVDLTTTASTMNLGALVGAVTASTSVQNSYATGKIRNLAPTGFTGGLIGVGNNGQVLQSYSAVDVLGAQTVGGLAGAIWGSSSLISNSYAIGSVTGIPVAGVTALSVGGLLGSNFSAGLSATITNSYSTGKVTAPASVSGVTINVGGLVGVNQGSASDLTVNNSFWDATTSGQASSASSTGAAGYRSMTTAQMMNSANFTNSANGFVTGGGWSLTGTPSTAANSAPTTIWFANATRPLLLSELFPTTGAGTATTYQIQNAHQLQLMAAGMGNTYTLMKKIDLNSGMTNAADVWGTNKYTGTGSGFVGIGDGVTPFTGTFNGNNYTIDNYYSRTTSTPGLFGQIATGALIQNIGVTNADVNTTSGGGILVGTASGGTITNAYTTGSITTSGASGGLLGSAGASGISISTSYSGASVTNATAAGGLVGSMLAGSITNSYATGNVTGISSASVGGLVGSAANTTISNSYSSGLVSGGATRGGFLGLNNGTVTTTNNYWDTTTSGQSTSASGTGGTGVTGLTTAQMMSTSNFSGWSLDSTPSTVATIPATTWFLFSGNTRPMLMMEYNTTITNAHQLQLAGTALGASYTLANDIDMTTAMNNASDVWATTTTSGKGFVPIGALPYYFSGSFNGQGYAITNIKINRPSEGYIGLFGRVLTFSDRANISNVGISGVITGSGYTGGLVGHGTNLAMNNVYNKANVTGTSGVGGLIGHIDVNSLISNSYNTGSVSSVYGATGGLAGESAVGSTITTSYNAGAISATGQADHVGGLIGLHLGTLNYSYNVGTVTSGSSGSSIGGAVGLNQGSIANIYSSGLVINAGSATNVAGLLGYNSNTGTITQSFWDTDTSNQVSSIGVDFGSSTNVLGGCFGGSCTNGGSVDLASLATYTGNGWSSVAGIDGSISSTISLTTAPPNYTWFMFNTTLGNTRPMLMAEYTQNITNAHQLQLMGTTMGGVYTLANDIDMAPGMNNKADVWGTNAALYNPYDGTLIPPSPTPASVTGNGFVPIGAASTAIAFTGELNGQYHTINNIFMSAAHTGAGNGPGIGLFLQLGNSSGGSGTVQKIGLLGGTILNSKQAASSFAGRLTGNGFVNEVFSTANVTAFNNNATATTYLWSGGLVGLIASGTGVPILKDSYFGGTLRLLRGTLANGSSNIESSGGLVGVSQVQRSIVNSFNLGLVACMNGASAGTCGGTNFSDVAGAVGAGGGTGSAISTYANVTTSGVGTAGSPVLATGTLGKTATDMQTQATYTNYDFTNVWGITSGSYAYLRGFYTYAPRVISGTAPAANTTIAMGGIDSNNNASVQTVNSYANNSFYFLAKNSAQGAGSFANGSPIVLYMPSAGATYNNIIRAAPANNANITGLTFNAVANQVLIGGDGVTATLSSSQIGKIAYQFEQQSFKPDYLWYRGGSTGDITLLTNTSLVNGASSPSATTFLIDSNISNISSTGTTYSGNSITLTGPVIFGNGTAVSVRTAGAQAYNGAATLGANLTLNTTNTGITFGNTLNGGFGLTTNSGSGTVTFGGIVGGSTALSSIAVNGASSPTTINASGITTTGDQLYAGPITLSQSTALTSSAGNITANGIIGGGVGISLTLSSAGTINLLGVNTYAGGTVLNSGTLNVGNNNALGTGLLTMNGGTLTANTNSLSLANAYAIGNGSTASLGGINSFTLSGLGSFGNSSSILRSTNTAGTITLSNIVSGAGSVQVNGIGGTLALTNVANTYTGSTTINAGTLSVTKLANYGASSSIGQGSLGTAGTLTIGSATAATLINANNSGSDSTNRLIALGAGGATMQTGNGTMTLGGVISGSGNLAVDGSSTLNLTGINTYSGTTTINNGSTVSIAADSGLGTAIGTPTANQIVLNGGTLLTTATFTLNANRGMALGTGGGTLSTNSGTTLTYNGILAGVAGNALTKAGAGTLVLGGVNTYNGNTNLNAGILSISSDSRLGTAPGVATPGKLTFNGGTLQTTSSFTLNANRGIALTGAGTLLTNSGTTLTYNGIAAGAGALNIAGAGTVSLGGVNTYSGATSINDTATLTATNVGALGSTSSTTVNSAGVNNGARLNIHSSIASLTNNNTIFLNGNGTGSGALTTTGGGLVNLANPIVLSTASTIQTPATLTLSGSITGSGNLTYLSNTGAGVIYVAGSNNYTGSTTLSGGIAVGLNSANALGDAITYTSGVSVDNLSELVVNNVTLAATPTITLNGGSGTAGLGVFRGASGTATFNGNVILNADSAIGGLANSTFILGGVISGVGGLNINPMTNATVRLAGDNSYSGTTTLYQGTLNVTKLANGASNSSLGKSTSDIVIGGGTLINANSSGTDSTDRNFVLGNSSIVLQNDTGLLTLAGNISTTNSTALTFQGAGNTAVSGVIGNGSGAVTKTGSGTLTLSGNNTYSGITTLNGGTLAVGHNNAVGSGNLQLTSGTLQSNGSVTLANNYTVAGASIGGTNNLTLSGTGTLNSTLNITNTANTITISGSLNGGANGITQNGAGGTLALSNANSYTGSTLVTSGRLNVLNTGALGSSSAIQVSSGATIDFNTGGIFFGNTTAISANGSGVGGIGALVFSGSGDLFNNAINLAGDTTLGGAGSSTLNGIISGGFNLTKVGAGTLVLNRANTYTGTTTIRGGTLAAANSNAFGSNSVIVRDHAAVQLNNVAVMNALTLGTASTVGNLVGTGGTSAAWNGAITLGANATMGTTLNSDQLTIGTTVSGGFDLTLQGPGAMTLSGIMGGFPALNSLTVNNTLSNLTVNNAITTVNNQSYQSPITLGGPIINMTSTNGGITLNGTVNGARTLILSSATGTTLGAAIGGSTPLSGLTLTGTGTDVINAPTITTTGGQTYSSNAINLGANTSLTSTASGISVLGALNSTTGRTLNITTATGAFLNTAIGGSNPLGSLTLSGAATDTVTTNVTTTGSQTYNGALALSNSSNMALTSTNGNITLANGASWSGANLITLNSGGDITLNGPISGVNGGLVLNAALGSNTIHVGSNGSIAVNDFNLQRGGWTQIGASLPSFAVSDNFQLNFGQVTFIRAAGGDGTVATPYQLLDVYGLQGVNSNATTLGSSYVLNNNIDASGTSNWTNAGGSGFTPIGSNATPFTGEFNVAGTQGYLINSLNINRPADSNAVGLFGYVGAAGHISQVGLTSVTITGLNGVGGLVGNNAGLVEQSFTFGTVNGSNNGSNIGGLVGQNSGTLTNVYSLSTVNGGTGSTAVGGLVGNNSGTVNTSYSAGIVTGPVGQTGGLAGANSGSIASNNYWDQNTSTQATSAGNATGLTTAAAQDQSSYSGWDFSNVWAMTTGTYPYLQTFNTNPIRTITGNGLNGYSVVLINNGVQIGSAFNITTGTSFIFNIPLGTIADNSNLLLYLTGGGGVKGNIYALAPVNNGGLSGLDFSANDILINGSATSASNTSLSGAIGGLSTTDILYSLVGNNLTLGNATNTIANLITTAATTYNVNGNINTTSGGTSTISFGGVALLNGASITTSGTQHYAGAVTVGADTTLTTTHSPVIFDSAISGAHNLTIAAGNGAVTLNGVVTGLTNLTVTGLTAINADVTIAGAQVYNSAVTLGGSGVRSLTSTNSPISFADVVNSLDGSQGLSLNAGSGSITFSDVVGGSSSLASLVSNGSGSVAVDGGAVTTSGNQSYMGALLLGADTVLTSSAGNVTASSVDGAHALTVDIAGNNSHITSAVTDVTTLTKEGVGTLTLSGTNSQASTVLNEGGLVIDNSGALGAGSLDLNGGIFQTTGTMSFNNNYSVGGDTIIDGGHAITLSGTGTLNSGTLTISNTALTTLSGNISGAGALTLDAPTSALILSGQNTYTGATTVTAGTLRLHDANALGNGTLNSSSVMVALGAVLDIDLGGNLLANQTAAITLFNGGTGNGALTFSGTGDRLNNAIHLGDAVSMSSSGANTLGGVIDGAFSLSKLGAGTLTLMGANTYSGGTNLNAGTLNLGVSSTGSITNGPVGTGTLTFNGGTLTANSSGISIANAFVVDSDSTIGGSNNITLSGAGTLNAFLSNLNTGITTLSGNIAGANGLTQNSIGELALSGTNAYSGATTVTAGKLTLNSANALGNSSGTTVANNAVLTIGFSNGVLANTNSISLAGTGIGSTGALILSGNNITLNNAVTLAADTTLGGNGSNAILSGNISGSGNVTKAGSGSLTLSGNNAYNNTTINEGTLNAAANSALGSGTVTINNGATLGLVGTALTINNNVVMNNGSNLSDNNANGANTLTGSIALNGTNTINVSHATNDVLALTGLISGSGVTLNKGGAGTLALINNANNFSGTATINAGIVTLHNNNAFGSADVVLNNATLGLVGGLTVANDIAMNNGSTITNGNSASTLLGMLLLDIMPGSSETINVTAGGVLTLAGLVEGGVAGSTQLILSGPGTVSLTGNNNYNGTTEVNAGTLNVANSDGLGASAATIANGATLSLTGTALNIANNLTLNSGSTVTDNNANANNILSGDITLNGTTNFNVNNATNDILTLSGVVSGSGVTLTKNGAGSLILSGVNTYTGTTAINDGVLGVAADAALGSSAASVGTGATLRLIGSTLAIANAITLNNSSILSDDSVGGTNTLNGSLTLTSGSATVAVNDATTDLTLAGVVDGTGSLVKSGAGNLFLANTNTYSGATTVSAGTLTAGAANALSTGDLTVTGVVDLNGFNQQVGALSGVGTVTNNSLTGATFTVTPGAPSTFTGTLVGNMGLTKMGAASLTLNGTNSYTGVTTVAAGTLTLGTGAALNSSSALNLTGTGTFNLNGNTQTFAGLSGVSGTTLNVGSTGGALTIDAANTIFAGSLQGTGAFTLNSGTLTLSGTNTYNGTTAINNGGILRLGASNALNSNNNVTVASGGAMNILNTFSNTVGSIQGAGNVDIGTGATLVTGNTTSTNLSGVLSGAGNLTKQGTGTFTLSGANTTYSGAVNINNGTLSIAHAQGLGNSSGVTVDAGTTLNINNVSIAAGPTISATGLGGGNGAISATGTAAYAGNIVLNGASASINSGTGSLELSGQISGAAVFSKIGSGVLTLSGNNTFTGNTTISAGTLRLAGIGNAIADTVAVQVNAGTTFDLNNKNETIGSLNGAAGSIVSLGSGILTTGNSTNTNYAGSIQGSGGLTKQGSGGFTLSGSNTYTGATTINAGVLGLGAANVLSDTTAVTLATGAGLNLNGNNETIGSLAGAGGTVSLGAGRLTTGDGNNTTFAGTITGTGGLTKQGSGILTLDNNNPYTGSTLINAGTLRLGTAGTLSNASAVVLANTAGATFDINSNNKTIGSLAGGGVAGGEVILGSGTLAMGANNASTTYSGLISGTGGINKVGTGTLILGADNNYTGTTFISNGTLQLGSANAIPAASALNIAGTGTLGLAGYDKTFSGLTGNGNINLGTATLTINNAVDNTYGGLLSGSGSFIKQGAGRLLLTQGSSYTGSTTLQDGTLELGTVNGLANSSSITIDSGAVLDMNGLNNLLNGLNGSGTILMGAGNLTANNAANTVFTGDISGSGQFIKTGTGTLTLNGVNTFTGATSINAGTLSIANNTSLVNSSGTSVALGAALNIANASVTLNPISLAGSLTSSGTSSLTGDINLAGNGVINSSGALTINGAITGTAGLTLSGAGSISLSNSLTGLSSVTSNVSHLILNGSAVTTTGSQYYSNTVTLGVDNVFTVGNNSVLALPAVWNGNLSVTGGSNSALYAPGKTSGRNTFTITSETGGSINDPIYFSNFYTINGLGNSSVVFSALAKNLVQDPNTGIITAMVGNQLYTFINIPLSAFSGNIYVPPTPIPTPTPNTTTNSAITQLMAQMTSSTGGFTPVQNQQNQTDNTDAMEDIYDVFSNPVVTANMNLIERQQSEQNAKENRRTYKICPAFQ